MPCQRTRATRGLLRRVARRVIGLFICQHGRLVYPPRADYDVCYDCGKKQLRNPATGHGVGKFSHNLNELIRTQPTIKKAGRALSPRDDVHTVLVFRNGKSREIEAHAIGGNAILVLTNHGAERVAISDLNVPATREANERRGIQFRLPA